MMMRKELLGLYSSIEAHLSLCAHIYFTNCRENCVFAATAVHFLVLHWGAQSVVTVFAQVKQVWNFAFSETTSSPPLVSSSTSPAHLSLSKGRSYCHSLSYPPKKKRERRRRRVIKKVPNLEKPLHNGFWCDIRSKKFFWVKASHRSRRVPRDRLWRRKSNLTLLRT